MKIRAMIELPFLATTALAATLIALGIAFLQPSGEQSKLMYNGNLWCVSNFIEKEPRELLDDGQPRRDPLLDGRGELIVREQITANSKDEAETKARQNGRGLFEPSEKTQLRAWLAQNNKEGNKQFSTHFNSGATTPGPCVGSGDPDVRVGFWLKEKINQYCGVSTNTTGYTATGTKKVYLTAYSPYIKNNACDSQGSNKFGDAVAADGKFEWQNGRLRFKDSQGKWQDYIYAEPQTDNMVKWSKRNDIGFVIPGFYQNQPIFVHDHYGAGVHSGQPFLDLFIPCSEYKQTQQTIAALPSAKPGGPNGAFATVQMQVVDTTQPAQAAQPATSSKKTLPDGTACPATTGSSGPSEGDDYQDEIATQYQKQLTARYEATPTAEEAAAGTPADYTYGGTGGYPPGGSGESPSFSSCHGRSRCHPSDTGRVGHRTINGWNSRDGDAVDIIAPTGFAYAAFNGVTKSHSGGTSESLTGVRLTSNDGHLVADYYHVTPTKTGAVKAGDKIGELYPLRSGKHIHFELSVNGQIVHGDSGKIGNEPAYMQSLWKNMKQTLGL